MYDTGYDSYRQAEIQVKAATASPAQLVLMLLDGLLDEMSRAEGHLLARNFERKGASIKNACASSVGLTFLSTVSRAARWRKICTISIASVVGACSKPV